MTDAARALNRFFSGFGLPAYGKNNVPDGAELPYITYEIVAPPPRGAAALRAWVWTRGAGMADAAAVCDRIRDALDGGGTCVEGFYFMPEPAAPFAQELPAIDRRLRGVLVRAMVRA